MHMYSICIYIYIYIYRYAGWCAGAAELAGLLAGWPAGRLACWLVVDSRWEISSITQTSLDLVNAKGSGFSKQ